MTEGAGDGSGGTTGVQPGALTALLREVLAAPESTGAEPGSLPPGTVIGRFEIVREVGRGGFGVVYEARDRDLGRQVAVKLVRPGRVVEEEGKVSREAEAIARLAHPNLITLFEVGRSEHGPFLVFEFLRGKTLQARMDDGPMPVQEAVHVATQIARGLAHAHADGVVHRDLKPSNVIITNKGQVKILDFGMAHAFGRRRISGGTPAYMAPEQWEDAPEDERTDVFALGVMLYRMLSGEYPFPEGEDRWAADPVPVRKLEVPGAPELADLVERMLDPVPIHRPRDGAAVLVALTPIDDRLRAAPAEGLTPLHAKRRKATFGDLLAELKRRHVFRVMVGYGIFSFAVLQVTEPVMHGADLPDWVLRAVLATLALGFPVAVILAWVYDLTSQGVKRTPSATDPDAPRFGRSRILLPLAVSAAVLVIVGAGAGGWYLWKGRVAVAPSIAVLPFADMSPSRDLEYFGDGVAEEILNTLAQVPGLKVIGRTSSFSFKGKAEDLRAIGQKLNAEVILEGSIRKDGPNLRITAQLVRARDGGQLWSRRFDSAQGGVFAVQDEIARAVASALRVKLLPRQDLEVRWLQTEKPEAYQMLLLGRSFFRRDTLGDYRRAMASFEKAVSLDPTYAAGWVGIADACLGIRAHTEMADSECAGKALAAAEKAVALAPDHPYAFRARAAARWTFRADRAGADADIAQAKALHARDATLRGVDASQETLWSIRLGSGGIARWRAEVDRDPLNPEAWSGLGAAFILAGDIGSAGEPLRRSLELSPGNSNAYILLGGCLAEQGRYDELLALAKTTEYPVYELTFRAIALHGLGRAREAQEALDTLIERFSTFGDYQIAQVYASRGETDRAFEWLERGYADRDAGLSLMHADPLLRNLRADPRWKPLVEKVFRHRN